VIKETYEVRYNIQYCNEDYWRMEEVEMVTIQVPEGTKGNNHYSARLKVELDLQADRICGYKIVRVSYC